MNTRVVLLVEDDPDNVELTVRAFTQSGFQEEIIAVSDGAEALDYLFGAGLHADRNVSDTPHLILLDLNMPKVDGFEVLERIRADERTRLLPVVILSTSNAREDMVRSYSLGANSYICKPVYFDQYIDAIQQLGRYWLALNEFPLG